MTTIQSRCIECGDCWHFLKRRMTESTKRHPLMSIGGKVLLVRRVAYEEAHGPIPAGKNIVPICGDPRCVNPKHQKQMTFAEVGRLAAKNGAYSNPARGKAISEAIAHRRKLSPEAIAEIKASDTPSRELAAKFGVNKSLIPRIRRGDSHKDYSNPWAGLGART